MSLIIFADGHGDLPEYSFYGGSVKLVFDRASWKYYKVETDGSRTAQYGVTSVLKIIDKSEVLIPWALKRAMLKLKKLLMEKGYVANEDTLSIGNILFEEVLDDIIAQAKKASREELEDAGEVGHQAHSWIESYILAILTDNENRRLELLSKLPEDERAASCVLAALAWMSEHNVRWLATERKCYSLKHSVAGTMDGLAIVDSCTNTECCPIPFKDRKSLTDWKSSNGLYISYIFQAAIYKEAYQEETGELIEDIWIIRLDKVSGEFDPWHISNETFISEARAGFLNALNLYKSVHQIETRIDGIKDAKRQRLKAVKLAVKEAALMVKCKSADKYKGIRAPKCNGGNPCETCLKIYAKNQQNRAKIRLDKHHEVVDNGS